MEQTNFYTQEEFDALERSKAECDDHTIMILKGLHKKIVEHLLEDKPPVKSWGEMRMVMCVFVRGFVIGNFLFERSVIQENPKQIMIRMAYDDTYNRTHYRGCPSFLIYEDGKVI